MINRNVKTLYLDIESSYMLLAGFGLYDQNFTPDQIIKDWHIISVSWMFEGDKKVSNVTAKGRNDKRVVEKLHSIMGSADIIVWHNGDKFDNKKLRARMIYHDLPPLRHIPTVDTLKVARKYFGFTSNRLGYLVQYLKLAELKGDPPKDFWLKEVRGDANPEDLLPYGDQDIRTLRALYIRLKDHIVNHPKLHICNQCGIATASNAKTKFHCKDCGLWQTI